MRFVSSFHNRLKIRYALRLNGSREQFIQFHIISDICHQAMSMQAESLMSLIRMNNNNWV